MVREGEILSVASETGGRARRWKVAMAEPVLQGVLQKGYTRFLVLPPSSSTLLANGEVEAEAASEDEVDGVVDVGDSEEEDEGSDDFEIDESFLANSVLSPPRHSLPPTPLSPLPSTTTTTGLALANGHPAVPLSLPPPSTTSQSSNGILVRAHSLQHPVSSELLVPRPKDDEDDTPRVYLRTAALGRLGLFSGDWVVVGVEGETQEERRLARVFSGDGFIVDLTTTDGCVVCSRRREAKLLTRPFHQCTQCALSSDAVAQSPLAVVGASHPDPDSSRVPCLSHRSLRHRRAYRLSSFGQPRLPVPFPRGPQAVLSESETGAQEGRLDCGRNLRRHGKVRGRQG